MVYRVLLPVLLMTLVVMGRRDTVPVRGDDAPPTKPSLEQRREAVRLASAFRRARKDHEQRAQIVADATALGRYAVSPLYETIQRELQPRVKHYRGQFQQKTVAAIRQHLARVDLTEVARLRMIVLELQRSPDFTKQAITQKADPAMQRLREIFLIDRETVLAGSEALQRERTSLTQTGQLWQTCSAYLDKQEPADEVSQGDTGPQGFEQYLCGEEELAVGMAAPMAGATRQILLTNARLATSLDSEAARAILALNLTRNLLGLNPLMIDLKLCAAAADHSGDMQKHSFFSHMSPLPGKKTPADRARRFGTVGAAENIYTGVRSGIKANDGWFHSPGHHKNMLGNHARVGVGRSGTYFTQMFGR